MVAPLRVLVVDDSLLYRKIVRDLLTDMPHVQVVGSATNGRMAIDKITELRPDLVTLDFEMPELDGLGVLRWLRQQQLPTRAVMLSAVTQEGADATLKALQEGAFDFVPKPAGSSPEQNRNELAQALEAQVNTIRFLGERVVTAKPAVVRRPLESTPALAKPAAPVVRETTPETPAVIHAVGIGISTGGPDALRVMLPKLPATLGVPIFLVQHMPPVFTKSLAMSLDKICALRVREAEEGEIARPNVIYIAPGGRQMKVIAGPKGVSIRLTDDPPVQSCRPSVDYLFHSLATTYGKHMLPVIMTGMGYDGADGCRELYKLGCSVIAQDEASCVVFGMPRKPVQEGYAEIVAPLSEIAGQIERIVRQGGAQ